MKDEDIEFRFGNRIGQAHADYVKAMREELARLRGENSELSSKIEKLGFIRPRLRQTHTYVTMEVSDPVLDEIEGKLRDAGYQHALVDDDTIDMHGIALVRAEDRAVTKTQRPGIAKIHEVLASELRYHFLGCGQDGQLIQDCATGGRCRFHRIKDAIEALEKL